VTVVDRPMLSRIAALAILAALAVVFCVGPLAAYCGWVGSNDEALGTKTALLQRYRALASANSSSAAPSVTPPAGAALFYADMPESQASALLQETIKNVASAAQVQIQGLQVLRGEALPGATRIGVRVRASGDIASLRSLIYAIETAHPILYPDNLQIQSHATASDTAPRSLDFQLDISGFKAGPES
jgi:hypothetical protein